MGAVLSTALMLGAGTGRADPSDEGHQGQQGTHLHGTVGDRFERASIPQNSAYNRAGRLDSAWIEDGQLVGVQRGEKLAGEKFADVSFSATVQGQLVTFSITQARKHKNVYSGVESSTVWEYQVMWGTETEKGMLCPEGAPALALPGLWSQKSAALFYNNRDWFSFACVPIRRDDGRSAPVYFFGGVAAKCVDWGYAPWVNRDSMPGPDLTVEEAFSYHAACTAMASADYCGQVAPNTVDGTAIVMFNREDVVTDAPSWDKYNGHVLDGPFGSSENFFLEAAWTAPPEYFNDGSVSGLAVRGRALCLSKKRWSTLPIHGSCPVDLVDPRVDGSTVSLCEQPSAGELVSRGAMLFSYSTFIDAGLYRFKHSQTGQFITTASVHLDPKGAYHPNVGVADEGEYWLDDSPDARRGFQGPILSPNVPTSFPGLKFARELWRYRFKDAQGFTRFITGVDSTGVPANFVERVLEGYVYADSQPPVVAPNAPRLHLWENLNHEYATSIDGMPGYSHREVMGYLPALSDYAQMQ
ncbi:hypothetical protein DAT35_46285 [Vitiosangium sp. GDMCC 1.1324]|nr:hypothetical protein DAT35_46285 [Vitiosangium sp. GDMCC 1.1324]